MRAQQTCAGCGASWIEATAREIVTGATPREDETNLIDPQLEVARLSRAAKARSEAALIERARRRRDQHALMALGAAALGLIACLFLFAERLVAAVPATAALYARMGMEVNVRGLAFRDVTPQMIDADGTRVFAIRGLVENISSDERRIPPIRFALIENGREIYSWQLPPTTRRLKPGESTGFLTRLAAPPEKAEELEIRFAREGEIGSNAGP